MNKTLLIIKREYSSRVKNKFFLLTTILTPLLFVLFIFGATYFSIKGKEQLHVAVVGNNDYFKNNLQSNSSVKFDFPDGVDTSNYITKGYSAVLIIPSFKDSLKAETEYIIRSKKSIGPATKGIIEEKINTAIEDHMLQQAGINRGALDSIRKQSQVAQVKTLEDRGGSTAESNQGLASAIGYVSGFLIYITMFIYGVMLMRGVMEEKTNRIAEVIVSSVKPFQLMFGKIVGIGAVGLTQFLIWVALIIVLMFGVQLFIPHEILEQTRVLQQNGGVMNNAAQASEAAQKLYNFKSAVSTANWGLIIGCFIFYFLGGYLFYAALFAAVGSVVEDVQNSQSLTLPITMPIIFSFIVMSNAVQAPDTSVAFWGSIIPFSSPMVMMARIAYGVPGTVPYWQLALSFVCLIGGFLFTTWVAAKIYRTGILMYGKKVTWKEMIKWGFRRG